MLRLLRYRDMTLAIIAVNRQMSRFFNACKKYLLEILLQYLPAIIGSISRARFLLINGLGRTQPQEKLIAPCGALVVAQKA